MNTNIVSPVIEKSDEKFSILGKKLPEISFSSFETSRLKNTELVWVNEELLEKYGIQGSSVDIERYLLGEYSYVSSGYVNPSRLITSDCKTFWADRYGSRHEVCNGGSARCGFDGYFQVKGVGLTPLLSQNMSKSHSNGKLFLDEAILETVWGEVCHRHLPFGAVRTLAIIKTNVQEEFLYSDERPKKPCALAVREFSVRPAHFERATFFWPSSEHISLRYDDAKRVRESIKFLPIALGLVNTELSGKQDLYDCLNTIILRISKQIAYSRVKGIPHGSLTSSNIGIDGRFLDFGTITAVPDFGNYALANGVGAVWDDHKLISDWLMNLFVTLKKYAFFGGDLSYEYLSGLLDTFLNELERQENIAILEELGVSEVNENNLAIAKDIKLNLVSSHRVNIGDFKDEVFRKKIKRIALSKGLKVGKVKFELRKFKYSSFDILNNKDLHNQKYSKDSIGNLIKSYC
ncbi:protein adenylyltransferase SelO family protein [Vibrio sp. JC009]|uniref:protein adenylyltransferase SelO family protein n=1 Tax=Vibrio sp. JC009 TaxID=2912314 RepID=UPI0023B0115A|nr:protein adenylyltransferase SelO family protein [Vibrio sp. JC009]WED22389.1 protein adenylyltransferase SelO family protein [Vibrio sp. JC009]